MARTEAVSRNRMRQKISTTSSRHGRFVRLACLLLVALAVSARTGFAAEGEEGSAPEPQRAEAGSAPQPQNAEDLESLVRDLGGSDSERVLHALEQLGKLGDVKALPALEALSDGRLLFDAQGKAYFKDDSGKLHDALSGAPVGPLSGLREPTVDNEVRRTAAPIVASLRLGSPDRDVRLLAAQELAKNPDPTLALALRVALEREKNGKVRDSLSLAMAELDIRGEDKARRLSAVTTLGKIGNGAVVPDLEAILATGDDGRLREPEELRTAAQRSLSSIHGRERLI